MLLNKINLLKFQLNKMLESRNLLDEDVINLSQQLDTLISRFYSLENEDDEEMET